MPLHKCDWHIYLACQIALDHLGLPLCCRMKQLEVSWHNYKCQLNEWASSKWTDVGVPVKIVVLNSKLWINILYTHTNMSDNLMVLIDVWNKSFYFLSHCTKYSNVQVCDVKLNSSSSGQNSMCDAQGVTVPQAVLLCCAAVVLMSCCDAYGERLFIQNIGTFLSDCTVPHPRRWFTYVYAQCNNSDTFARCWSVSLQTTRLPGKVHWP
jgi:hypothetical protein